MSFKSADFALLTGKVSDARQVRRYRRQLGQRTVPQVVQRQVFDLLSAENRRYGQLAWILQAATLQDIDCIARVPGRPYIPVEIFDKVKSIVGNRTGIASSAPTLAAGKGVH